MEFVANFELNNNNLDASFDLSEGASFDALFEIYASGTTWGSIDGDIANQTDLYNILMSKADKTTVEADLEAINDTITENYETLDNKIDSVQSDLSGDISALSQTVINNNTAINNRVDNIVESFDGDIEQINSNISDLQTTVSDNYTELNTKIQNEAAARAESDSLLQGNINTLSNNLTAEISNRESADSGLQTQITNLSGTVSSNYSTLNNSISNLSDTVDGLSNTVDDLSDTVDSNYNILDTKINTTQTTLQGNIDTLNGTVTSNYNDLTQSITNNVSTLNTRITNEVSTLNGAISNEATVRANADNNLQTQIDAIVSSSDVFDIVGTYAELEAYDISTVPVNDIIKVLVDSTHNNAATYYRCVENNGVKSWSYIGSEGAYYTKGEADSTFVPQTRTINNKALNQNINLTASDVGALPVGTQIGNGTILLTQGGVQKGTFTLNQTGNATIDFDAVSEDITVDSELSTTSENPVQNKVITGALDEKVSKSGDTMTGILKIKRLTGGNEFLQTYPNVSLTTPPATTRNLAMFVNYDTSERVMAKGIQVLGSDGSNAIKLNAYNPKSINQFVALEAGFAADGTKYALAPETSTTRTNPQDIITRSYMTSANLISALGYTPYNATNPNGYTSNVGTVTSVNGVQPVNGNVTIETGGSVDQVFDGESANAQSGIAIQGALDGKQDELVAGKNIKIVEAAEIKVPEGYQQLNYIYANSAAMIKTGLTGSIQWEIGAKSYLNRATRFLVSNTNETSTTNALWFGQNANYWGGGARTNVLATEKADIIVNFNLETNNVNGTVNGVSFTYTRAGTAAGEWALFGSPDGNTSRLFDGELYYAIARQNGVVVFDGVPAIQLSDDDIGLYDTVSGEFFPSDTTSFFWNGDDVYEKESILADLPENQLTVQMFGRAAGYFQVGGNNSIINASPTELPKEFNIAPLNNSATVKPQNSLLYCGNDNLIHSYQETDIPISLQYGMFYNRLQVAANAAPIWYTKLCKGSWTMPTGLGTITARQKVYARCTYPDSNGDVYFIDVVGQANTTNALEGGYTYYYLGLAYTTTNIAFDVTASHFMSIDTNGNLTHIDGVEVAQPESGKDLYDYYSLNADIVGTPTVEDCIVSDFSSSNYVEMRNSIPISTGFWEFQTKFTTGATVPTSAGEFQFLTNKLTSTAAYGITLFLDGANPGTFNFTIGNISSAVNVNISSNTTYIVKAIVGFSDTYAYDGKTHVYVYDNAGTLINSWSGTPSITPKNLYMKFGTDGSNDFDGSIDFENTFINSIELNTSTLTGTVTRIWTGGQATIDTKVDTDLNNITDSAKVMISGLGMPSDKYTDLTLGASGSTYTAPADGYFAILMNAVNNTNMTVGMTAGVGRVGFTTTVPANNNLQGGNFGGFIPVKKGDTVNLFYQGVTSAYRFRFVYAVGSESEV